MTEPDNSPGTTAADEIADLQPIVGRDEVAEADEDDARTPDDIDDAVEDDL